VLQVNNEYAIILFFVIEAAQGQMSGYQVFLGNLPFAMDENGLGDLVSERVSR
jgi:hypothetical protein